jgi:hypothetical protein
LRRRSAGEGPSHLKKKQTHFQQHPVQWLENISQEMKFFGKFQHVRNLPKTTHLWDRIAGELWWGLLSR